MKALTHYLLPILLLVTSLAAGAYAQTREPFVDTPEGFKVSRALEADGSKLLLVIFPEKYLVNIDEFNRGTSELLVLIFGCSHFDKCKPVLSKAKNKAGQEYVYANTNAFSEGKRIKILIRGLKDEGTKVVGVALVATTEPLPDGLLQTRSR